MLRYKPEKKSQFLCLGENGSIQTRGRQNFNQSFENETAIQKKPKNEIK